MSINRVSERAIATVWSALASYESGDYLPSATKLSQMTRQSHASIGSAYRELHNRGYLERRGNCFVKIMAGAFVPKISNGECP